ncbi:interleukin-20 receptor subunit alpha-like [Anneissia japonica]|uniref:interleukin-20 receptor subunit alpha-like n=1 Tax=Anneissia japonica TaxID=1529436 RepID=UPI001425786C|nr:interleukin-20 receptor subunit alpha-like [Anneissia japonica]
MEEDDGAMCGKFLGSLYSSSVVRAAKRGNCNRVKGIWEPTDIRINTLNLETVMSWRAPVIKNNTHTVYYQVESKNYGSWDAEDACQHILKTFCAMEKMKESDFIAMGFPIYARVRASLANVTSNWVETRRQHRPSEEGKIDAPLINNISMLNNDTLILDLSFPETPYKAGTHRLRADDSKLNLGVQVNVRIEKLKVNKIISKPSYRISNVHLQQNTVYTVSVLSVVRGGSSPVPNIKRFEKKGENIYILEEIPTSTSPDEATKSIKPTTEFKFKGDGSTRF